MKRSTIYRKAARRIADGKHFLSCLAISKYDNYINRGGSIAVYEDMFQHSRFYCKLGWWNDVITPENQMTRSLALLFMAEIAKDEYDR